MHNLLEISRMQMFTEFLNLFLSVNYVEASHRLPEVSSSHIKYHTILFSVVDIFMVLKSSM